MSSHVLFSHAMSRQQTHAMSCQFMPCQVHACHVKLTDAKSCQAMSCHVMSCQIVEVDALKVRSSLDTVKQEIAKLTGAKKHSMIVGQIEPCAQDSLQRFKRGRKAFGSRVESRFVATSVQGIANAKCGAMTYLEGDTFFNRWPVKLIPVSDLKQMDEQAYEKMWESVPGLHPQYSIITLRQRV